MKHELTFEEQENYIEFLENLVAELGVEASPAPHRVPSERSAKAAIQRIKELRTKVRAA